jgi:serine protease AprX
MNRRTLLVTLSACLIAPAPLLMGSTAMAAPDLAAPDRSVPDRSAPARSWAPVGSLVPGDRDHDHVADDFEATLQAAEASRMMPVIITGITASAATRAVGRFSIDHRLPLIGGFAATMTGAQARALAHTSGVRRIEGDGTVHALDESVNDDFGATLARTDTPGLDGSGVGLCVVDTGVDPDHEQISPRSVTFKDFVNDQATAYDDQGHGTHVAGIAAGDGVGGTSAASFIGVAPAATLYAAKVLDSTGNGSDSNVVAGVQWCAAQPGVDVISMSLGDTAGGDGTDASSLAVDAAVATGITVVVAAGNTGDLPETINSPGTARDAITVGAVSDYSAPTGTDRHDDGIWLAAFSSRGPTSDGRTKPDVVAPGVTVRSARSGTVTGYVTHSGTSMATPYVAGAAVLAREANPDATPDEIKAAITGTAVEVGAAGPDNEWGAGLVDVRAVVDTIRSLPTVRTTPFPDQTSLTATVPNSGAVEIPVEVLDEGVGQPLAVTMTLDGSIECDPFFGCLFSEWSPDIDLELLSPTGDLVASSSCALNGVSCGYGRQETIGYVPTVAGTYTLYAFAFTGSPNDGKGGSVTIDLSRGPIPGTTPPPPPPPANVAPVANAGPDKSVKRNPTTKKATFNLNGWRSTDADGTIVSYVWTRRTNVVGTTKKITLTRKLGKHRFVLTVTDDDGATSTDAVVVRVVR